MGFSFHDENSLIEASAETLRFTPANDLNPTSETGGTGTADQERGDYDDDLQHVGIEYDDSDIQIVDRQHPTEKSGTLKT